MVKSDEISSEYINSLPVMAFRGVIKQVNSPEMLSRVMEDIEMEPCVGFDTESRPSFIKGKTYPVSLVQIATPSTAYIIKVRETGLTDEFLRFMESSIEKIGVGLKDDIRKLQEIKPFQPESLVDLSDIAKTKGYKKTSLRVLCARYLNQRIVKSAQKTNWARNSLTDVQLRYAATDAWACLVIRPLLEKDLGNVSKE